MFVTERGEPDDREELVAAFEKAGIEYEFGGHTDRALRADRAVVSPGVPESADVLRSLEARNVPVIGELEAAWRRWHGPVVAVTGTNGKSTTVRMLGAVYESAGRAHVVAGNVGVPLSRYVLEERRAETAILEVSSFQLDRIERFRPDVAVLLNISADHLDRYDGDLERYARSKARIFGNQRSGDVLIYDWDDRRVRRLAEEPCGNEGPTCLRLSAEEEFRPGAVLEENRSGTRSEGRIHPTEDRTISVDMSDLRVLGPHNRRNALAAATAALSAGVDEGAVGPALQEFEGMPHRLEPVRAVGGVRYVNDSKATNVEALRWALESFSGPVVLIAGGRDKGNDYGSLADLVEERVAAVVAVGESKEKVMRELGIHAARCEPAGSLEQAVQRARELAPPGSTVLLSPACSSFDMFDDYRHRGRVFKRTVHAL